jgi:hypothetical protein
MRDIEALAAQLTDQERHALIPLLLRWRSEHSTIAGYIDMDLVPAGPWVDLEPDWSDVDAWLK